MSDFLVNIDSYLDLSKAETQMKNFLSKYNGEKLDIKVEINPTSINTGNLGKQLQTSFGKAMSSVSFDGDTFVKQYIAQMKKDMKEADKIASQYKIRPSQGLQTIKARNTAEKKAIQAVYKAQIKAEQDALKAKEQTQKKYYDKILSNVNEEYRLKNKLLTTSSENERKELNRQLKSTQQRIKYNEQQLEKKSLTDLSYVRKINDQKIKLDNDYRIKSIQKAETTAKQIAQIESKVFTDEFNAKLSTMGSRLGGYDGQDSSLLTKARQQAELYKTTLSDLKRHFDSNDSFKLNDEEVIASFNTMNQAAKTFDNTMIQVGNTASKTLGVGVADRAANNVKKYMDENSKALKKYKIELEDLEKQYRNITTVAEKSNLDNQFKNLKAQISAEGLTGKGLLEEIGRGFKQISQFVLTYGVLQQIPEILMSMANSVIEVDSAMTSLYKVTDETTAKYDEFLSTAGKTSKELGRSVSSYIEQTATWAKLGYTVDQSSELAKVSSIYANVGDVDDETAVSDLVTVMKAYNMGSTEAINIVDMLNELGNNYATDAASLGDGLKNMASTMAMSNTSLEKSLAILTGGSEITQDSGELGNAIKVAVLRLHGQKGALEDIGEYADDVESVSKMQTQILKMTNGAVNIMEASDPTAFRDYYDVMADIAKVLPSLDQTTQADLIETLFGKNRANQGQAILQAFQSGQIQKAYETTLNAQGSAQKEQDRWLESAEAKIQQFQSQFQSLSTALIGSAPFKGLIDTGTSFLEVLTNILEVGNGIPALLGTIGGVAFFKNLDQPKSWLRL